MQRIRSDLKTHSEAKGREVDMGRWNRIEGEGAAQEGNLRIV